MQPAHTRHFANTFASLAEAKFSTSDYSRLKFGSNQAAKRMGRILAESFFKAHRDWLLTEQFVVVPSPYNYVKNAATVLSEHFVDHLNYLVAIHDGAFAIEWDIIHRKVSYINDYGFLSKEDRKALIEDVIACGGKTVGLPLIGCGLAGGKWSVVEAMIEETLVAKGLEVFIYKLE